MDPIPLEVVDTESPQIQSMSSLSSSCDLPSQQQIREVQMMNQTLMSRVQQYNNNNNGTHLAQVVPRAVL